MSASAIEAIDRIVKPTQQFTRGWMLTPDTAARGKELGLSSGQQFWICGRAGVLGECTAETAIAGLVFHAPERIRRAWDDVPAGLSHLKIAEEYAAVAVAWGERELAGFDVDRLELLDRSARRIIDAAPSSLGAVFAGWRALPQPDSAAGRVGLTTQVFREMRGAAHVVAITAVGLTPLQAILSSTNAPPRTGPEYAERMGFEGPFPDPALFRERRLEAEALTTRILEPFFAVLEPDELDAFADVFVSTRDAIDM
jgi:hypothetical protein